MSGGTSSVDVMYQDVIDIVGSAMGESNNYFQEPEIRRWWNHYVRDFSRRTKVLQTTATYTWPANTDETALTTVLTNLYHPSSNISGTQKNPEINKVEWVAADQSKVPILVSKDEVLLREPDRSYSSEKGNPRRFYYDFAQDKAGMQPTPSVSATLRLYYSYEPVKFSGSTTQAIDYMLEPWWTYIVSAVIGQGKRKDRDHFTPDEADREMMIYENSIPLCRLDIAEKSKRQGVISFHRDYSNPS